VTLSRPVLELWDDARGKWILYPSEGLHSVDCAKYPFESIPTRVFLDTNVVNLLVKHSEHIFEQLSTPSDWDLTRARNVEALMHVFFVGARANWDILASRKTIEEIERTSNAELREELLDYAICLVEPDSENSSHAASLGRRLIDAPFTAALPDVADRVLLGNAIGLGCDAFCTCDGRTIIEKRSRLSALPIRILKPEEWWAHVKPWAGLWC
jgi:hypothetical protein